MTDKPAVDVSREAVERLMAERNIISSMDEDPSEIHEVDHALIFALRDALDAAEERAERFEKLDREAATHVETIICMRTHFTGDPPYVGWKGLGLALREHLDRIEAERDAANARAERAHDLLQDCYRLLDQTYRETSSWPDNPPEPADEWSYNLIPIFSAIQNETGKDHGELTALKTQEASK